MKPIDEFDRVTFEAMPIAAFVVNAEVQIRDLNGAAARFCGQDITWAYGQRGGEVLHCLHSTDSPDGCGRGPICRDCVIRNSVTTCLREQTVCRQVMSLHARHSSSTRESVLSITVAPLPSPGERLALLMVEDVTEIAALRAIAPSPLIAAGQIAITDLFSVDELQKIVDAFAEATGVASIITYPDGIPITRPSNFCQLCEGIIRTTARGRANCVASDSILGKHNPYGPTVQRCLSSGLLDAGASITVAGKHLANWLVGQVKNEDVDEDSVLAYAAEIGADPEEYRAALRNVPVMSTGQFHKVARLAFLLANDLSLKAFQNLQQAQVIADRHRTLSSLETAHRALEESESRYRYIIELSPDAILVGKNRSIAIANKTALGLFGVEDLSGLVGHTLSEFLPASSHAEMVEVLDRLYSQQGEKYFGETTLHRSDGSTVDVEIAASSFMDRDQVAVQAVIRDLSQRKRLEAEHVLLGRAIEQTGESVMITDSQGTISYVNPAFERTSGYSKQEVIGKSPSLLKSGLHPRDFYTEMWSVLARGGTWAGTIFNKAKNGSIIREDVRISPVRDRHGVVSNYVGVKRDVTKEQLLQEQLHQAQKVDALGRLAGGIAHDFNNILMIISSYAEMLQATSTPGHSHAKSADEILQACARAAELTQQLLAFSRKQIIAPKLLDLRSLTRDTSKMLKRLIGEDVELSVSRADDLGLIKADSGHIVQILLNLCANARDAMPTGGKIDIEARNVQVEIADLSDYPSMSPGRYVLLSVRDNGLGMSPEVKERLFEPFFSTKPFGKGTGLGLATVYGIVKQNGGFIWVESELNKGSCFKCYFPRVEEASAVVTTYESAPDNSAGTETILLVEDEPALRDSLVTFLAGCGYTTLKAADGEDALKVASEHGGRIDLLVTDVVMPRVSGRELQQRLSEIRPGMRTIFMSGYTDDSVVRHGLRPDVTFIQKPFSLGDLARMVRATVRPV